MTDADVIFGILVSRNLGEVSGAQLQTLVSPFGITNTTMRSTLSRMRSRGMIDVRREGRNAYYRIGARGQRIGSNVRLHFTDPDWSDWDGSYWGAMFSIPQAALRYRLQKKLTAYRFRPLYPGVWIRPRASFEDVESVFGSTAHLDLIEMRFAAQLTAERVASLYRLDQVGGTLREAASAAAASLARLSALDPAGAFREYVYVGGALVTALAADPLLPPVILPEDWPGPRFRKVFHAWTVEASRRSAQFVEQALRAGSSTHPAGPT